MKKKLLCGLFLCFSSFTWAQILVPVTTDNRLPVYGKVGVGISAPKKSLHIKRPDVYELGRENHDGDVWIDGGKLEIGKVWDFAIDGQNRSKILSDGSLKIQTNNYPFMMLAEDRQNGTIFTLGIAIANQNYSHIAKKGDLILKSNMYANSYIFANENKNSLNNFKFTTTAPNETYASTKLFIGNNGNIGIGTESPDAKLAVNGDVHAKEVRIDLTGWPDYVFEEAYVLPTIEEVERHINEKGHLINIPSATEVETGGLHVSDMIKKQQEKIEELTLYIIELNKQIQEVKAAVNQKN